MAGVAWHFMAGSLYSVRFLVGVACRVERFSHERSYLFVLVRSSCAATVLTLALPTPHPHAVAASKMVGVEVFHSGLKAKDCIFARDALARSMCVPETLRLLLISYQDYHMVYLFS